MKIKRLFHNPLFVTLNLFQGLITQMLKRVHPAPERYRVQHDTTKTRSDYVSYETGSNYLHIIIALIILFPIALMAYAEDKNTPCFECHSSDKSLTAKFSDGREISMYVDQAKYIESAHGKKQQDCQACHFDIDLSSHPSGELKGSREYTISMSGACRKCHGNIVEKFSDGVHSHLMEKGNTKAAICADCHNPHYASSPKKNRAQISHTCSKCHQNIYDKYASSIHGKALLEEHNTDVPVCTDCHQAHRIEDPRSLKFHISSVDICGKCHGDSKIMKKYGIPTDVVNTYLQDFHNISANFYKKLEMKVDVDVFRPTCVNCHGVHDINKINHAESVAIKSNITKVCQKCHPDATDNFSDAWLSHYIPSLKKAPLVYLTKIFYWILIPFMILGLLLQIILDFRHTLKNRAKTHSDNKGESNK